TVRNGLIRLAPEDTFLNLNQTNYSQLNVLSTYTSPAKRVAHAIVMKFDLSAVPAGAVIQDAELQLSLVNSDKTADATYVVSAHKLKKRPVIAEATGYRASNASTWTPSTCCSGNIPLAQADITPAYDSAAINKTPGVKTWRLTAMVREWLANPSTNYGVLLNADTTRAKDRFRHFASMEHANARLRPSLKITYTPPPT